MIEKGKKYINKAKREIGFCRKAELALPFYNNLEVAENNQREIECLISKKNEDNYS